MMPSSIIIFRTGGGGTWCQTPACYSRPGKQSLLLLELMVDLREWSLACNFIRACIWWHWVRKWVGLDDFEGPMGLCPSWVQWHSLTQLRATALLWNGPDLCRAPAPRPLCGLGCGSMLHFPLPSWKMNQTGMTLATLWGKGDHVSVPVGVSFPKNWAVAFTDESISAGTCSTCLTLFSWEANGKPTYCLFTFCTVHLRNVIWCLGLVGQWQNTVTSVVYE